MKRKLIIISGSRADYGLLKKLVFLFQENSDYETFFAATGSHLSLIHGKTVDLIRKDKVENIVEVEMNIEGDKASDVSKSIGVGIQGFSALYEKIRPDFIVVLGDRYELWAACIPATVYNIPIVHIHGGELTFGAIDDSIRHSITKLSHLHFCSHATYRDRIIQMGENPSLVHVVGAIGLDRIKEMQFSSREEIEKMLNVPLGKKNILCTFHPVTINESRSKMEIDALIEAVQFVIQDPGVKLFVTFPNADTYSSYIRKCWNDLISKYPSSIFGFTNLGDQLFLSLMKEVELVLGNSSSGIIEAPFLKSVVVDVGDRQRGRLRSGHILHSSGVKEDIIACVHKGLSNNFQTEAKNTSSIYGEGKSSEKIIETINKIDFNDIREKNFFDLEKKNENEL